MKNKQGSVHLLFFLFLTVDVSLSFYVDFSENKKYNMEL